MDKKSLDLIVTIFPMSVVTVIVILIFSFPVTSNIFISQTRLFFTDTLGVYYLIIGITVFLISLYLSFSSYGNIVIGDTNSEPRYSFFTWGSMMFTCGLAADILFYSFSEWIMYASNPHISELGNVIEWAGVFPLFHWGFIPWSFYLVLAVAFGFMIHVKKKSRQRFSEACRPLIREYADGVVGKIIDIFTLFALIAGTATTFSIATPLLSSIVINLLEINVDRTIVTITILIITCIIYSTATIRGLKGIEILAKWCIYLFFLLLFIVFFFSGQERFIIENGIQSFGKMIQNFIVLSTYVDPNRTTNFPQDWTIYYWAYWMVWCVAAPFFIGNISQGRTIKQIILGGYLFGVSSTIISFIVLGNYSLALQSEGIMNFLEKYQLGNDLYSIILDIVGSLPCSTLILILIMVCMIAFYATSFDSIAYTAACYSYKELDMSEKPHVYILILWCIILILLPIALVFSESSMSNIQSISIISAFPLGIIIMMIIISFLKEILQ